MERIINTNFWIINTNFWIINTNYTGLTTFTGIVTLFPIGRNMGIPVKVVKVVKSQYARAYYNCR